VHVTIGKGEPARTMFNQTVNGTSTRNALFRAADVAVQQLTGAPGYFAGKIAFIGTRTGHREVYTSDLFFGEASQITHDRAHALSPRWSPDGSRIIYTSFFRSGSPDIYVMTPGTGQRTSFASFKGTNSGARFSPDGSRVAAVLSARGIQEIFVANSGGRGFRRLTNSPQGVINAGPAWSPDSSRIIFTSDRNGRPGLFTMSSAGGAVTPVPTGYSSYSAEADWNRVKPNLIAFTAGTAGGGFQIALYDTSTRQSQILTRGADSVEPCWLADGRHLVYTSRSAGVSQLKVLDTDTGKATLISPSSLGKVCQASFLKR
jgi:TolB protein